MMRFLNQHGTKIIGLISVLVGWFSVQTNLMSPRALQAFVVANGLITVLRGWYAQNFPPDPPK